MQMMEQMFDELDYFTYIKVSLEKIANQDFSLKVPRE